MNIIRILSRASMAARILPRVVPAAAGVAVLGISGFIWGAPLAARALMEKIDPEEARDNERELLARPRTILAVGAHPDDLDYYCSGTLARLADYGNRVVAVACTNGEKAGIFPFGKLGHVRLEEQRESVTLQGIDRLEPLGLPDGQLTFEKRKLYQDLARVVDEVKPDVIFTFDPLEMFFPGYVHPDHQAAGGVLLEVAEDQPNPPDLYFFHTRVPNTAVDITSTIDTKIRAMQSHWTQLTPGRHEIIAMHLRSMARTLGRAVDYRYAEMFRRAGISPERHESRPAERERQNGRRIATVNRR